MAIASLEQYLDYFLVYTVLEWLMHGLGVVLMEMELCSSGLLHDFWWYYMAPIPLLYMSASLPATSQDYKRLLENDAD
jgi:hypothetical protein